MLPIRPPSHSPSQTSMAEEIYHDCQQLNSSQPASPWAPSGFDAVHPVHYHHPYDHHIYGFNGTPPHCPHMDEYPHKALHHRMVSASQTHGHDYPGDPSHEPTSAHRIEMAQEDVDAAILSKRKVRNPKACYVCHRRKVRCNRELPCDPCVKRGHPELCLYKRPTNKRRIAIMTQSPRSGSNGCDTKEPSLQSGLNVTVPKEQWERINKELQELREQIAAAANGHADDAEPDEGSREEAANGENPEPEGIHALSNQMATMHLGSRSVLAYLIALRRSKSSQDSQFSFLNESILPALGLDNDSVTYPFVDLWSPNNSIRGINGLCSAIPDDNLCKQFFYAYRDVACTIYPVVPEPAKFEATLDFMLANRSKAHESTWLDAINPMGISLSYLALVFAVLASGAQCSSISAKERELTSQVYICCSYQALRMGNFLTHPSLETIEALLIITNVLSYNMNPGAAYIFLGFVVRTAFSMGLQINQSGISEQESWLRRRIWWAIAWQDSHLSVSYDRPTATVLCTPDIPYGSGSTAGHRTYAETMYSVIRLTQEIIRERTFKPNPSMSWTAILRYKESVMSIVRDCTPHVRERSSCENDTTKHIERLALKLHSSYVISELCRPALRETWDDTTPMATPTNSPLSSNQRRQNLRTSSRSLPADLGLPRLLRRECIRSLERTVEAYVELYAYSEFAARSWVGIQCAISAAFLLGTVREANQEPRFMGLLKDLENCIVARTNEDPTFEPLGGAGIEPNVVPTTHLSDDAAQSDGSAGVRSLTQSLYALRKLNATLANHKADVPTLQRMAVTPMYMDRQSMRTATTSAPLLPIPQPRVQTGFATDRPQFPIPAGVKQEP